MQDFPGMAARFGLELTGYLNAHLPARLELFVRVNYEAFFFADEESLERFLVSPIELCGLLTDPVTKHRFRPAPDARPEHFEGVDFYFETETSRDEFLAMPAKYVLPGYVMEPGPEPPVASEVSEG